MLRRLPPETALLNFCHMVESTAPRGYTSILAAKMTDAPSTCQQAPRRALYYNWLPQHQEMPLNYRYSEKTFAHPCHRVCIQLPPRYYGTNPSMHHNPLHFGHYQNGNGPSLPHFSPSQPSLLPILSSRTQNLFLANSTMSPSPNVLKTCRKQNLPCILKADAY